MSPGDAPGLWTSSTSLDPQRRSMRGRGRRAGRKPLSADFLRTPSLQDLDGASGPGPRPAAAAAAAAAPGRAAAAAAAGLDGGGGGGQGPGPEEGHQDDARLPGAAGGDAGADVRAPLCRSDERVPPRAAAGAARQTEPELPDGGGRAAPGRRQGAPPGQPAQRLPLGLQDAVRPHQVPPPHPGGLLPVQRLPAGRAPRRGQRAVPQRSGLRSRRRPAENRLLRRRPPLLHRDLRVRGGGMHVRAAAVGEGARRRRTRRQQAEPGEERGRGRTAARVCGQEGVRGGSRGGGAPDEFLYAWIHITSTGTKKHIYM